MTTLNLETVKHIDFWPETLEQSKIWREKISKSANWTITSSSMPLYFQAVSPNGNLFDFRSPVNDSGPTFVFTRKVKKSDIIHFHRMYKIERGL